MAETDGLELPIGLTEQKFAQQLARIEAAAIRASQRAQQSFVKANADIGKSFGGLSRSATANLQNVSYQVQDIFVQIASGQGAARALGQQLPQLLGGFGALGAIVGVAAAAGIPLVSMLIGAGEEAKSLDDILKELEGTSKDYQTAVQEMLTPMSEMYDMFGNNTEQAREMQKALVELARIRLAGAIETTMNAIYTQFEGVKSYLSEIKRLEVGLADPITRYTAESGIAVQIEEIRQKFGLTRQEAEALATALDRFDMAEGVREQVDAMNEVIRLAQSALSSEGDLTAERRAGLEALINMGLEVNKNAAMIETSADASEDLATNTGAAADEASRIAGTDMASGIAAAAANALTLAQRLAMAAEQAAAIGSAQGPVDVSEKGFFKPDLNRFGNPYAGEGGAGPSSSSRPKARPDQMDADWGWDTPKRGGGGGGGSSRDKYAAAVENVQQRIDALKVETAAYLDAANAQNVYGDAAEYAKQKAALLTAAQEQGKEVTPELSAQIEEQARAYAQAALEAENAKQKMDAIADASERGKDALGEVFGSILEGSDAAKKAIASLLMEIAKVQMMKGALGILNSMPGGSAVTSWIGGLMSMDGGGYTGAGSRTGGLDGKGGFLAMLHPRETVIDHTKGQRTGGGAQVVQVYVSASEYFDARVDQRAANITQHGLAKAQRQQPDSIRKYTGDPRRRS
jgi:hypothetical protein